MDEGSAESALRIIVAHAVSRTFLPIAYREGIRSIPGVKQVVNLTWLGGQYKDDRPENAFAQFGTDPAELFKVYLDLHVTPNQLEAWQRDRAGCVVDAELSKRYGWKIGDRVVIKGVRIPVDLDLTIRGVFESSEPGGTDEIFFNQTYLDEAFPKIKGYTGFYGVLGDSPQAVAQITNAIDAKFRNSEYPTKSWSAKAFGLAFIGRLGNVKAFILSICSAVVFATLLVSATTIAMSIRERIREAALLRTLGFTRGEVAGLFVCESVSLAVLSAFMAVVLAAGLIPAIAKSPQSGMYLNRVTITSGTVILVILVSAVLGALSSLVPAYKASHQNIAGGLRHIG